MPARVLVNVNAPFSVNTDASVNTLTMIDYSIGKPSLPISHEMYVAQLDRGLVVVNGQVKVSSNGGYIDPAVDITTAPYQSMLDRILWHRTPGGFDATSDIPNLKKIFGI